MEIVNGFESSSIQKAVRLLDQGDVVAFPTETVYGLGADAQNPYAVAKIFQVKNRPRFDPLIVHISQKDWIFRYAKHVSSDARKLIEVFWPGPLTLLLEKQSLIPDIVTAGLSTVGMRMPAHGAALNLIDTLNRPIAAPSANPFGYMSPTKAAHVARMLKGKIPLILDGGDSVFGIESTIISFQTRGVYIHRHGAVSEEDLREHVEIVESIDDGSVCRSPGELPYHYAPMKPLKIVAGPEDVKIDNSSFLSFRTPESQTRARYMKVLSATGDLNEAAANFFSSLIDLDREDVDIIYAEKVPPTGIGRAIMERLNKASKRGIR
ncbi:MAG TPA: L-threonylcarbamoyladenylate synthase [Syntrophorhabdaceae bacterium]|nr:L-threonylcarbamoyladenylate synthase [Syntrophorhabdaceae bacterium]